MLGKSWTSGAGSPGAIGDEGPQIAAHEFTDSGASSPDRITSDTLPLWYIDFTDVDVEAGDTLRVLLYDVLVSSVVLTQFQIDGGYINFGLDPFDDGDYTIQLQIARTSEAGNNLSFTIDTTAPTLSSPVGTAIGETTATVGATTNETRGTMFVVVTGSAAPPTSAQILAGLDGNGDPADFASSQAITTAGAKTFNATGLQAGLTAYSHVVHRDAAGNVSSISTSSGFTTTDGTSPAAIFGNKLIAWYDATAQMSASRWDDQSGHDFHLVQATAGNRPTTDADGISAGKPGLVFTGGVGGDWIETANLAIPHGRKELCVISLVKLPGGGGAADRRWSFAFNAADFDGTEQCMGMVISDGTGITGYRNGTRGSLTTPPGTPCVIYDIWDGDDYIPYLNNVAGTSAASAGTFRANLTLALAAQANTSGTGARSITYGEFIMAKTVPSPGQMAALQAYFAAKWGI